MRALLLAWRARGDMRIHSSSRVQRALAGGRLLLLALEALALLVEPGGVVALEGDAAAAVELEDPAGDVVEEVAVVGDGDDRARVLLQMPFEPGDRLGVEVVGGLVEQQQVGLLQQQPAEGDAAPLAAGEGGDVGVARRQAQRVHGDLELCGRAPRRWRRRCGPAASPAARAACSSASSSIGSPNCAVRSPRNPCSSARVSATPSSTLPSTVFDGIELRLLRQEADAHARRRLAPRR